jgi:hypothetical protein
MIRRMVPNATLTPLMAVLPLVDERGTVSRSRRARLDDGSPSPRRAERGIIGEPAHDREAQ